MSWEDTLKKNRNQLREELRQALKELKRTTYDSNEEEVLLNRINQLKNQLGE